MMRKRSVLGMTRCLELHCRGLCERHRLRFWGEGLRAYPNTPLVVMRAPSARSLRCEILKGESEAFEYGYASDFAH